MEKLKNIPILMYHYVVPDSMVISKEWAEFYVTFSAFKSQMQYLLAKGFTAIDFNKLADIIDKEDVKIKKPVIITFDDAYKVTMETVMPVLKELEFIAVVSLVTGSIGEKNHWDKCQIDCDIVNEDYIFELNKRGVSFVSHTKSHPHLNNLNNDRLRHELIESKEYIEKLLNKEVNTVVYPYGEFNENVKKVANETGYSFACAVSSTKRYVLEDLFEIRRVYIKGSDSLSDFKRKISGWYLWFRGLKGS